MTKIFLIYYHKRDLQLGPQGLLNSVHQTFWPSDERNNACQVVYKYIQCLKIKLTIVNQIMGDLPPVRVIQNPLFLM